MKLTIERDVLAVALSRVVPVINSRQAIPILTAVKIGAAESGLTLTGSNFLSEVRQTASAIVAVAGEICTPADKFGALVNSLPSGSQLEIEVAGGRFVVRYGRGKTSLQIMDAADYPAARQLGDAAPISIDAEALHRLISTALPFVGQEETRPYLRGIFLHTDGERLAAVATDGNALAKACCALEAEIPGVIVSSEACRALLRILGSGDGDVSLTIAENGLRVDLGACSFATRLVDGTFPDYQRVVPQRLEWPIIVDRAALKEITQRVHAVTDPAEATKTRPRSIRLEAAGSEMLITAGSDADQRIEEAIEVTGSPESVHAAFGTAYLLNAIEALDGERLQIHISGHDKPVLLRRDVPDDPEFVVIMTRRA